MSESNAARFITRLPVLLFLTVSAVYVPSIFALIDCVRSLASGPIPVQTPSLQGPTSLPIVPSSTWIFKFPPFLAAINVLATPAL